MIKTRNLLISGLIISVCVFALFFLLFNTSIPIFTVKELIDHPRPESLLNHKIQLIGIVGTIDTSGFLLYDPEDQTNATLIIYIEAINVTKPGGFVIGKTILVEGQLTSISGVWTLKASMISTKCPSKYDGGAEIGEEIDG
ncbi:MAG: hypothetical protein EAX86_03340 [Candidatus Heimdallarchaeota archaeon]|nr:hypothetical protein [Candidatus Heimdallarchaeota archaeon]